MHSGIAGILLLQQVQRQQEEESRRRAEERSRRQQEPSSRHDSSGEFENHLIGSTCSQLRATSCRPSNAAYSTNQHQWIAGPATCPGCGAPFDNVALCKYCGRQR